jgi:hypothetical protein
MNAALIGIFSCETEDEKVRFIGLFAVFPARPATARLLHPRRGGRFAAENSGIPAQNRMREWF